MYTVYFAVQLESLNEPFAVCAQHMILIHFLKFFFGHFNRLLNRTIHAIFLDIKYDGLID